MITTATTLAELEVLRLQHNVQSITMHKVCGFGMPPGILVVLETLTECRYFGSGPDISEALASAFARVAPHSPPTSARTPIDGAETAITVMLSPTAHHNLRELLAFFDRALTKHAGGLPLDTALDVESVEHYRKSLAALRPML